MRLAMLLCVLFIVVGLLPAMSVFLASGLASLQGCDLSEASPSPCVILGADRGETLYAMFVLGWLAVLSLPLAAVGFVGILGMGLWHLLWR